MYRFYDSIVIHLLSGQGGNRFLWISVLFEYNYLTDVISRLICNVGNILPRVYKGKKAMFCYVLSRIAQGLMYSIFGFLS